MVPILNPRTVIDTLIAKLSTTYILEDQGNVNDNLGIQISKDRTSKIINMMQLGLIDSIISDVNLDFHSRVSKTPPDSILHPDPNGLLCQSTWNYCSVIGKLNFLAQNTRPDISFSVHQCVRFCTKPTQLHELAVLHIVGYLLATKDHGLILHPTADFKLDVFVDVDLAGMYHHEYSSLRENILS